MKLLCAVLFSVTIVGQTFGGTRYFVKTTGSNASAGTSWAAAFATLQHADSTATSGDTIWVAAGTYYPSTTSTSAYFQLKNGVVILGGFNGTETLVGQRDWQTNVTTLSGDINNDGTLSGNSNQVIYAVLVNSTSVLDGFVITGGNSSSDGGGVNLLVSSPALSNLTITGNHAAANGGGLCNNSGNPTITNCSFAGNSAAYGGGMYNYSGGVPVISGCKFQNNSATTFGGGFYNTGNTLNAQDLLFDGNHASTGGGGLYEDHGSTYVNLTFYGNTSKYGGGMFVTGSSANLANTILWNDTATTNGSEIYSTAASGTTTISSCLVQGGVSGSRVAGSGSFTDGGHNIDLDPLFTDSSAHNFTLTGYSPAIDSGNNAVVTATTDLADNVRISDGHVDIGAYEYQGAPLAVQMASFSATPTRGGVQLRWITATETDNFGFEVERRRISNLPLTTGNPHWSKISFVKGAGTSNAPHHYGYIDGPATAGRYSYRLRQIDQNGSSKYSGEVDVMVELAPREFSLGQNYPNPFNPTTTIDFTIPNDGRVVLRVFDLTGREVATLVDGNLTAGSYHQAVFDGTRFSSGLYFARLEFAGRQLVRKMLMIK